MTRNNDADFLEAPGHSVTYWLDLLKGGQPTAVGPIWRRYYDRLVARATGALPPAGDVAGDDVAASVFGSLVFGIADQKFHRLDDRHDLWRVLVTITDRKVKAVLRRRRAAKRGGQFSAADPGALDQVADDTPPPDVAVLVDDQCRHLLGLLDEELQRIAIYRLEGYTNDEIAAMLKRSLRTITNKLDLIRKIWFAETSP